MLYEILRAGRAGADSDLYALLVGRSMCGGRAAERELTGTVPLRFRSDGSALLDWHITGAVGGVSAPDPNLYPPIDADSVNRGYWGIYPDGGLYGEACYNTFYTWRFLCNPVYLETGTYTFSVYIKADRAYEPTSGEISDYPAVLYFGGTSDMPHYDQRAEVEGSAEYIGVSTSYKRHELTFTVTTAGYVYPGVQKRSLSEGPDVMNIYVTCFQLEKAASASSYIAYDTEYCLPVKVTGSDSSGEVTRIVNIPLDAPLGSGETLTKTGTGIAIPTFAGRNIIDINTVIPPSEVYIKYIG